MSMTAALLAILCLLAMGIAMGDEQQPQPIPAPAIQPEWDNPAVRPQQRRSVQGPYAWDPPRCRRPTC